MTRIGDEIPQPALPQSRASTGENAEAAGFDAILKAVLAADEHREIGEPNARPVAVTSSLAAPSAQSFNATGPFGLARAANASSDLQSEANGYGNGDDSIDGFVETNVSRETPPALDKPPLAQWQNQTIGEGSPARPHPDGSSAGSSPHSHDMHAIAPQRANLAPIMDRIRTPPAGASERAFAPRRNPNALSVRLIEDAGAISVRATLPGDSAGDGYALGEEVERALLEYELEGEFYLNGRRIAARKERFDV